MSLALGLSGGVGLNSGGGLPVDGSPTLVLNFVENTDITLSVDFINNNYKSNSLDASNPTPVAGSYWKWE